MIRRKSILVALAILLGSVALTAYFKWRSIYAPNTAFKDRVKILLIPTGATFGQVLDSLRALDVLRKEDAFRWVAEKKRYPDRVRPGRYRIEPGMSSNALVNKLRGGEQDPVRLTFTNIRDLPHLAGRIARYLECDSLGMLRAINDPAVAERYGFTAQTFIGMFLPNTYEVWWTETPEDFIARMAREHKRFWTDDRTTKAAAIGLSQSEVSTLASIVQAETARPDEAPRIAGVYLNRLRIGMPLQADPTLKFALGLDSLARIWDKDKLVDSPYNTYTHAGLPPGPINLPEPRYIDAVLNAEKSRYLYFCARADLSGYHDLARTYEQHLVNARRYQRALDRAGIYR